MHDYAVNRRNEYNLNSDYYEDEDYDDEDINDRPYCFRFTWIGSKFGSSKLKNRTCAAIVDKADLICEQPLFMNGKIFCVLCFLYLMKNNFTLIGDNDSYCSS